MYSYVDRCRCLVCFMDYIVCFDLWRISQIQIGLNLTYQKLTKPKLMKLS